MMDATLLLSLLFLFIQQAVQSLPSGRGGGPGTQVPRDVFNAEGVWNRTYDPLEPQQIHMAWLSDGVGCRIQFATAAPLDHAVLRYWPSLDDAVVTVPVKQSWAFVDGGEARHTIHLHNVETARLEPDTIYRYQIQTVKSSRSMWSDVYEFRSPTSFEWFEFLATADMGVFNAISMPNLVRMVDTRQYDFLAFAGDQAYDMADFNGTKGDEYMNFVQAIYARLPVMTTPGNHEATYNFSHYKHRFNILPFRESGYPDDATMYSFDYKALHFVSFSSEVFFSSSSLAERTRALAWLDTDLDLANQNRHARPWIIVMAHRPLYCTAPDDSDCTAKAEIMRRGLEQLLLKHRVDLYLCGHRHNYERTYPVARNQRIATSYRDPPSFFELVVGNAGNFQGPDPFPPPEQGAVPDWSAIRFSGYGFTTIKVSPESLLITHHESLPSDGSLGRIIDRIKVTKSLSPMPPTSRTGCEASFL